jgi:hypothetical protein
MVIAFIVFFSSYKEEFSNVLDDRVLQIKFH